MRVSGVASDTCLGVVVVGANEHVLSGLGLLGGDDGSAQSLRDRWQTLLFEVVPVVLLGHLMEGLLLNFLRDFNSFVIGEV